MNNEFSKVQDLLHLPPHYEISLYFIFEKFEEYNENFELIIDNSSITQFSFDRISLCNNNSLDTNQFTIRAQIPHSALSLNISLKTQSSADYYWRIYNFTIDVFKCHQSCLECSGPNENECMKCYPFTKQSNGICSCYPGFFYESYQCFNDFPCSKCQICDSSCKECDGINATNCLSCNDGFYLQNKECIRNFVGVVKSIFFLILVIVI